MIISLLVVLIIAALLFWVLRTLAAAFALPPQIVAVLNVVLVVMVVLWILRLFGVLAQVPLP